MLSLLAPLLRRLGGFALSLLGSPGSSGSSGSGSLGGLARMGLLALALALPLLGLKCAHSRLEDLRADYQALEAERASLEASLALCREAASLSDAVLVARERENRAITNKYRLLRGELLRGLSPTEEAHAPKNTGEDSQAAYASWCAQPVPHLLRGLLAAGADGSAAPLSAAPGPAPHADGSTAAKP